MRNPKKKPGALYHSTELLFRDAFGKTHTDVSGEYLVQCQVRYDDRFRRKFVLVMVASTASPSKPLGRVFEYRPVWRLISKFEEVQKKDLPLFVSWVYKSELFQKLFTEVSDG